MATLTPQQWITKMDARIKEIASDKLMTAVIQDTIAHYTPRIFDKGLNSRNMVIGTYSTKSLYVNPKTQSPKAFGTLGKNGKSTFKNGSKHKTRYFASGYKQFKGQIGRGTKVKGLTKHFGGTPIFNLTKQERAKFVKDYKTEVLRILNN